VALWSCTFGLIQEQVDAAVEFWSKDDLYKDALS